MRLIQYLITEEVKMYPTPSELIQHALKSANGGYTQAIASLVKKRYNATEKDKKIIQVAIDMLKKQRVSK